MKKFAAFIAMFLLYCLVFSACESAGGKDSVTDTSGDDSTAVSTEAFSEIPTEATTEATKRPTEDTTEEITEDITEQTTEEQAVETTEKITEQTTEKITEQTTEEATEEETYVPPLIDPAMPDVSDAVKTYVCGDGTVLEEYSDMDTDDFVSACDYLINEGFSEYCSDNIGDSLSATYIKNDEYYTLLFAAQSGTFYIGHSDTGALALPAQSESYEIICETTVTQGYSQNINGMTYIIRLADGSFIVVDGGYVNDAKNLYKTLCSLSGKESGIRIRAWIFSHAHDDHYPAFGEFAINYADKVKLECVMYSPVPEDRADDHYFNGAILEHIALFDGAKAVTVHAGMTFKMADVTLEVLNSSEYVYKDYESLDFNESSAVYRVKNDNGSVIFLGDCYDKVSRFLLDTYGDGLKSEMMQVSHHGVEQATVELYDMIAPSLAFWPCDEWLLTHERGTTTKQYLLSNENIYEHVIHGYGNATRPLSYKAQPKETVEVLKDGITVYGSESVSSMMVDNGVIKYKVRSANDPYVWFETSGISASEYNAVKLVIKASSYTAFSGSNFYFTCADDDPSGFSFQRCKLLGPQGTSYNGVHTLIVYLGNTENYEGDIKSVRIDVGNAAGQKIEIRSVEFFWLDIDK